MTQDQQIRNVQHTLGLVVDGIPGAKTWRAVHSRIVGMPSNQPTQTTHSVPVPADEFTSISDVYGQPGNESNLVQFNFPYEMKLYGDTPIKSHRCHKLCKSDLEAILETARDELGMDFIRKYHLDHYDGCYNYRRMRGGSSVSRHSWGIAIDIAAEYNGNHTRKPQAEMPGEFIEIFQRFGWKSGGAEWGRDYMHFQRTK
jgi:hypothetical protein